MPLPERTFEEALHELRQENDRLRRSVKELSLLNDLAVDIGSAGELETVMKAVIRSARKAVEATQGVVTLVDDRDESSILQTLVRTRVGSSSQAFSPTRSVLGWMKVHKAPLILHRDEHEPGLPSIDSSANALLSVPMTAAGRLVGILTVYDKAGGRRFSKEDARLLSIMAGQSAQAVHSRRLDEERRQYLDILGRYAAPEVVEELVRRDADLSGARREASIMFADIRGFSAFAERTDPEAVVDFLNRLFETTLHVIPRHRGIVHQLLGDGFMAIFGVPIPHGNHAENAVSAALEILRCIDRETARGRLPDTRLGIGLHSGEVIAGLVGSLEHQEYKVTGDAVNVAARIEDLNKQYNSRLLASETVIRSLNATPVKATPLGSVVLRGRRQPLEVYRLA